MRLYKATLHMQTKTELSYIDAVVKEVLRWCPAETGRIPHAVIQYDEYMGFHIPKGATMIGNHWSIHLDENVYKNPYTFNPDRGIKGSALPFAAFGSIAASVLVSTLLRIHYISTLLVCCGLSTSAMHGKKLEALGNGVKLIHLHSHRGLVRDPSRLRHPSL
jgi:hypothetical protein